MKKKLLVLTCLICCALNPLNAQLKINSLSVNTSFYVDNACNQPGVGIGFILADAFGGTPPYSFLWSDGSTDQNNYNLMGGVYTVTVTDAIAGTATVSQTINDIQQGTFNAIQVVFPTYNSNNGKFIIAGFPGTETDPPLDFGYSNFGTGASFNHINYLDHYDFVDSVDANQWQLSLTTASGCYGVVQLQVESYPDFIPTVTTTDACAGFSNGKCLVHFNAQSTMPALSLISSVPGTSIIYLQEQNTLSLTIKDSATQNVLITHIPFGSNFQIDSSFTGLPAGNYIALMAFTLYNNVTFIYDTLYSKSVYFTINNTSNCGTVSGQVFSDVNTDCVYNAGDMGLPNVIVAFDPGGYLVNTDANGNFSTDIPYGTYGLTQHTPLYINQICLAGGFTFTLDSANTNEIITIADSVDFTPDGKTDHNNFTPARPGFNLIYAIYASNISPNTCTPALVTLNFDSTLNFISASKPYSSLTTDQIQFNLDTLSAFENNLITVTLYVPPSAVIGDTLFSAVSLSAANGETNLANNFNYRNTIVTGSYDPNDKSVVPEGDLKPNVDLNYTIRFQNTGNDTAFTVTVIDTISPYLDITSIQPGAASHAYVYDFPSPGVIRFTFNNILLVDSNHNEPLSHGFINYAIRQQLNNPVGTLIENTAGIYFDFNAPVITNTTQNTVQTVFVGMNETGKISFKIFPNPVTDILQIQFNEKMIHPRIEIINTLGETVMSALLPDVNSGITINTNISILPGGVYMIIIGDEKRIFTQRIIKQ